MKRGLGKSGTRNREENREKTIEARKTSESSHGHVVSRSKGRDGQEGQPSGRLYVQQRYRKVKQWTALPFHGAGAVINTRLVYPLAPADQSRPRFHSLQYICLHLLRASRVLSGS